MKRVGVIPVCKTRSTKYNKEESGGEDYQETTNFGSLTKWWFALSIDMNYGELTDFGGSMSLKIDNGDILKTAKRELFEESYGVFDFDNDILNNSPAVVKENVCIIFARCSTNKSKKCYGKQRL